MRNPTPSPGQARLMLALTVTLLASHASASADPSPTEKEQPIREIFVPYEDLDALLESQPRRVLLSRREYDALLEKAKTTPETHMRYAQWAPICAGHPSNCDCSLMPSY